jgi:hypothetical protein
VRVIVGAMARIVLGFRGTLSGRTIANALYGKRQQHEIMCCRKA